MANYEIDEVSMLSETYGQRSDELVHSKPQKLVSGSASIFIPMIPMEPYGRENSVVGNTGPHRSERETPFTQTSGPITENHADRKNEHLLWSGKRARCNDPYCTTCPTYCMASTISEPQFPNAPYGGAKGFARKSFLRIRYPHDKEVQRWNRCWAIFCMSAIFVDPLFFFLLYVKKDDKCIDINSTIRKILFILRSINDLVYLLHILFQFRIAYVSPRKLDAGDLVYHPKKIALHYMRGYFSLDLFIVIPLPQIMITSVLPILGSSSEANFAKNLLNVAILVQYIPRLIRFLPVLIGWSPTGFIFQSAWANCIINILIIMLTGHVVGSCWYLFGLQRVNRCLRAACSLARPQIPGCLKVIECEHDRNNTWSNNTDAIKCLNHLTDGGFAYGYGIYANAVPLTMETNMVNKYIYSLFWGFQQISTLAGNQTPSYYVWEVLFTMVIIGVGLLLVALLIGNIQNYLKAVGQRRLDMQLRDRGVEQWRLDIQDLKRRVRQAERYSYAATSGVNEEMVMENLPEDLKRDIRRHLFEFIKKDQIFWRTDEHFLDAIYKRLRRKTYIKGSTILCRGGLVENMFFIVRGELECTREDGTGVILSEGDACGEELLKLYEHSSVSTDGNKERLSSNKTVRCLTNVDAFSLLAADLEEVIKLFR